MIDQFKDGFIDESLDLLNFLEKDLLQLEASSNPGLLFEEICRILHTLKGVSGMYGFEKIGTFAHKLENLYNSVSSGKVALNKQIISIGLTSIDLIKSLFEDPQISKQENQMLYHQITGQLVSIVDDPFHLLSDGNQQDETKSEPFTPKTFFISFQPEQSFFIRGINILNILLQADENHALIFPLIDMIPPLEELIPDDCYSAWSILIYIDNLANLEDIFFFCSEEYKALPIAEANILFNSEFTNEIHQVYSKSHQLDFEFVKKKINDLLPGDHTIEVFEREQLDSRIIHQAQSENEFNIEQLFEESYTEYKTTSVKISSSKLDDLVNLTSELVITQSELSLLSESNQNTHLINIVERLEKISRRMRDSVFSISMIPIKSIVLRFHRLIRDLSNGLNKVVNFETEGTRVDVDKTLLDTLSDPIMHIIRNCIDHGIEKPHERIEKGKPPHGTIKLKAYYSGSNVIIEISDDGAGINLEKIQSTAIKKGLITEDTILQEEEIVDLIFLPGFTTTDKVTEVSGRGVGMDVVKQTIIDLRGIIKIETESNVGTRFILKLPLNQSIEDMLWVKIEEENYLIPIHFVIECMEEEHKNLSKSKNKQIMYKNSIVPFIYLRNDFGIESPPPTIEQIVFLNYAEKQVGLVVDKIMGEFQAVLKPLGELYRDFAFLSGAAVLGDGKVALSLEINNLIKSNLKKNRC